MQLRYHSSKEQQKCSQLCTFASPVFIFNKKYHWPYVKGQNSNTIFITCVFVVSQTQCHFPQKYKPTDFVETWSSFALEFWYLEFSRLNKLIGQRCFITAASLNSREKEGQANKLHPCHFLLKSWNSESCEVKDCRNKEALMQKYSLGLNYLPLSH